MAFACGNKTICLWDAIKGKPIATFKTSSNWVYTIAWSPDGSRLATAVAWSPDGTRIASASNDKTIQVWQST